MMDPRLSFYHTHDYVTFSDLKWRKRNSLLFIPKYAHDFPSRKNTKDVWCISNKMVVAFSLSIFMFRNITWKTLQQRKKLLKRFKFYYIAHSRTPKQKLPCACSTSFKRCPLLVSNLEKSTNRKGFDETINVSTFECNIYTCAEKKSITVLYSTFAELGQYISKAKT